MRAGIGSALFREASASAGITEPLVSFRAEDGRLFNLADDEPVTVDMFGALGDLRLDGDGAVLSGTNDTDAFQKAAAWLQRRGGGTLHCRPGARYLVGRQRFGGSHADMGVGAPSKFAWAGASILRIVGATAPVVIEGNGALMKAAPGYRYGVFDRESGAPKETRAPHFAPPEEIAFPYVGMVEVRQCTQGFTVRNLELDGSAQHAILGGEHGDLGRQLNGCGLFTIDNRGSIRVEGVRTHHHPFDGWLLRHDGSVADASGTAAIADVVSYSNGRQALSLTGGIGGLIENSRFEGSGRGLAFSSAPGAGLDIEAEGFPIRDWRFRRCMFGAGAGVAMLADTGDIAGLLFQDCQFHGADEAALWPKRPGMRFENCLVTGMVLAVHPGTMFVHCRFTDDPAASPYRRVQLSSDQILVNLANAADVQLSDCMISRRGDGIALYSDQRTARFTNCAMTSHGSGINVIWGEWMGVSRIEVEARPPSRGLNAQFTRIVEGARLAVNGRGVANAPGANGVLIP